MSVLTLQQQLDDFLSYATGDVLIWHDPTGAASRLIELAELPSDVALFVEQDMPRFELLCKLNNIAPDERALVIRTRRKRIEEDDWLADLEARAESFEPDLAALPRSEHSVLNRAIHALKQGQEDALSIENTRRRHTEKEQRRAANRQAWWRNRYGMDAPEPSGSSSAKAPAVKTTSGRPSPTTHLALTETWYARDKFLVALDDAGISAAPDSEDDAAAVAGYTLYRDCAIRGTYATPEEYYRTLFAAPLLSQGNLPQELRAAASFKSFLASARSSGAIFDYDNETWITPSGLRELEIERQDLDTFAQQAVAQSVQASMPQFTVPWLRTNATGIPLLAYELSDVFYESVLLSRRRYVTRGHLAGRRIFGEPHAQARGRDLVESLLKLETSINVDELYDILRDDYGINLTHAQLVQLIRGTNLFYSPEFDRVYVSHDQFVREVE